MDYSKSIKALYKEKSLRDIARFARSMPQTEAGDLEFFRLQRNILQNSFPGFRFEFATLSTVAVNAAFEVQAVHAICLDIPKNSAEQYQKIAHYDDMSPLAYLNAGRALRYTDIRPHEEWLHHPFFEKHCLIYDIHQAVMVCFCYPGHRQTFIAFEYLGSTDNKSWAGFDHTKLELASFPFALAWLYRRHVIDDGELSFRFLALSGLTELELVRLRKYVNSPLQSFNDQAIDLGVTEENLKNTIYGVRRKTSPRFGWDETMNETNQRNSLRGLDAEYSFLRLLGDATRPITLKLR